MLALYGASLFAYAQRAADPVLSDDTGKNDLAVVAIIFVMALIDVFLSIMGVLASNERNSAYMQVYMYTVVCWSSFCVCFSFIVFAFVVQSLFIYLFIYFCDYTVSFSSFSNGVTYRQTPN